MLRWKSLKEPGNMSSRATRHANSQNSVRSTISVPGLPTICRSKVLKIVVTDTTSTTVAKTIKEIQGEPVQKPQMVLQMRQQCCRKPKKKILGLTSAR
mmetsp:Transcript_108058/g.214663  ORF Transcript_108058/g.214663 Transcript_108058/m.214663 type:complete len:98 (-) Transcript_108058:122-415(-)